MKQKYCIFPRCGEKVQFAMSELCPRHARAKNNTHLYHVSAYMDEDDFEMDFD